MMWWGRGGGGLKWRKRKNNLAIKGSFGFENLTKRTKAKEKADSSSFNFLFQHIKKKMKNSSVAENAPRDLLLYKWKLYWFMCDWLKDQLYTIHHCRKLMTLMCLILCWKSQFQSRNQNKWLHPLWVASVPPTLSGSFEKQDGRNLRGTELSAVGIHRKEDGGPEYHGKSPPNHCLLKP